MKNVANYITFSRILFALILLLLEPFTLWFFLVYIICGVTDMVDGLIARKTNTESKFGSKLDSIADFIFVVVCLVKILPSVDFPMWFIIWVATVFVIKISNIISGYVVQHKFVMLHTFFNKITGFLLFVFPLTLSYIDIRITAIPLCVIATFAAIQEGHFIRTRKEE